MFVEYDFNPNEIIACAKLLNEAKCDAKYVVCVHCISYTLIGNHVLIDGMPWCLTCAVGKGVADTIDKQIEEEYAKSITDRRT
jgi:hypothetical protein